MAITVNTVYVNILGLCRLVLKKYPRVSQQRARYTRQSTCAVCVIQRRKHLRVNLILVIAYGPHMVHNKLSLRRTGEYNNEYNHILGGRKKSRSTMKGTW